ncbi:MAG TPA: ABC transporter permease [Cellulomonas sp.]
MSATDPTVPPGTPGASGSSVVTGVRLEGDPVARALAAARRPRRLGALYVAEYKLRSMRAYGWTIVVMGVGAPLLYLIGLGSGLETFVGQLGTGADGRPVDYLVFVAPALLVTAAVSVSTEEFTYSVMEGFKWRRTFWAMNATPVAPTQVAGGLVLAVVVRMTFTTIAYALIALAFGAVSGIGPVLLLPLVGLLAGLAFGLPLLAYSAGLTEDTGQFSVVQRFVFTPMFLFSGTFYPLDTLPTWLHWIGWISPVWHATELGRVVSFGAPTSGLMVAVHLVVLVALAVGGWLLARQRFERRLRG